MSKMKNGITSTLIITANAIKKLNPFTLFFNPVIFITEIFAIITSLQAIFNIGSNPTFSEYVSIALWATVIFSNFADSYSEYLGSKQLKIVTHLKFKLKTQKISENGTYQSVSIFDLRQGDLCVISKGEFIPSDGEIQEGTALIDESFVNGSTEPVIKTFKQNENIVYAGSKVISDQIIIKVISNSIVRDIKNGLFTLNTISKKKSKNDITISLLLSALSLLFIIVITTFQFCCKYYNITILLSEQIAFMVCLIPTTIAGLLHSIKTANISRLLSLNILASSSSAIEAAGAIDVVYFDKTGTMTHQGRFASEITPSLDISEDEFLEKCYYCSLSDASKENKSIIEFLKTKFPNSIHSPPKLSTPIPYSAYSGLSGIDIGDKSFRKGTVEKISTFCKEAISTDLSYCIESIREKGETPILIASQEKIYGIIHFKEEIKANLQENIEEIKRMGIEPILLSGDTNSATRYVANELSINTFQGQLSSDDKLNMIRNKQDEGYIVGMIGDGMNDRKALDAADFSLSMHDGSYEAQEVAGLIDLDSDPSKLAEIIKIGKQMFVTRGSITTFSIATDLSKFFIMIPSIFSNHVLMAPKIQLLEFSSPASAILSVIIFNAIMILFLIPVSIRGVKIKAKASRYTLNRNIIVYGLGGIITPIFLIKTIDYILSFFIR